MTDGQTYLRPLQVPGIEEAVRAENEQRDMAFLALGDRTGIFNEQIAGVPVLPFTARHLLWLDFTGSAFTDGELFADAVVDEIIKFFRVVQVPPPRRWWQFRVAPVKQNVAIMRTIRHEDLDATVTAIRNYIADAFADAPAGAGGSDKKYFSFAAGICHFLGKKYSMPPVAALDVPLKVVFQLMKASRKSKDANAVLFNPSDNVIARHVRSLSTN